MMDMEAFFVFTAGITFCVVGLLLISILISVAMVIFQEIARFCLTWWRK